ncbi:hypothetical protein A2960_04255 [Candidatus Gottesmanbacteria bacterium RIFCSPLOWO2_01_FULL_39_12b]|uniref:Uncharacterized protein n=1 Tax=Candidatus Gottesmanbacteria bacterium RIFCSPLOWO2_01_FULL_39_12b TaxID=1798388 RepID=A0A1F6AS12_9BACT|nr:MAG: hypothetical protein A2960_04255 [Candidatus Gottesmanbacteria bacterium RIFCSPLOWO2_01_FULL_39_12b]
MIPDITPDLRQNIIVTIYLIFSHNYIAFMYLIGLLLAIGLAIYRPSRFTIFTFLGFAILLFSYEYDKHIISALREQTTQSLITLQPHYKLQKLIDLVISSALPVFFYVLGWIFIFIAIIYGAIKIGKSEKNHH